LEKYDKYVISDSLATDWHTSNHQYLGDMDAPVLYNWAFGGCLLLADNEL